MNETVVLLDLPISIDGELFPMLQVRFGDDLFSITYDLSNELSDIIYNDLVTQNSSTQRDVMGN